VFYFWKERKIFCNGIGVCGVTPQEREKDILQWYRGLRGYPARKREKKYAIVFCKG
jgi:hypothetical protein